MPHGCMALFNMEDETHETEHALNLNLDTMLVCAVHTSLCLQDPHSHTMIQIPSS